MPEEATVEEVEQLHIEAWRLGPQGGGHLPGQLQGGPAAVHHQEGRRPATPRSSDGEAHDAELAARRWPSSRRALRAPDRAWSSSRSASGCPGAGSRAPSSSGWPTARATSPSASTRTAAPARCSCKVSKQGSTLAGIMDAFAISVSLGLQHGVPLADLRQASTPTCASSRRGMTDDPELRIATSPGRLHLPPAGGRLPARTRSGSSSASSPPGSGCSRPCPGSRRWPRRARRSSRSGVDGDDPGQLAHDAGRPAVGRRPQASGRAVLLPVRRADAAGRQLSSPAPPAARPAAARDGRDLASSGAQRRGDAGVGGDRSSGCRHRRAPGSVE